MHSMEVLTMTKEIAERIKAARKAKGLTQLGLGEALGYEGKTGEHFVSRWERNERPVPLDKIRPLANVLGLTIDDLIP